MSAELDHIWSLVQARLAATVDESTYRIWLAPLTARELLPQGLVIEASPQACGWLSERFSAVLQAAVAAVIGEHAAATLVPAGAAPVERRPASASPTAPAPLSDRSIANPRLTFEQFVIGDCNRLAHGAALAVAEMPAQAYNPLFICGPPGVGKTHLLQSIAALLKSHQPDLTIQSLTGEAFTNEFLTALAGNRAEEFKIRFRHADVLLVDDVQFLERKVRTEEEFFHTFDALYHAGSQIVLTSDRPPRDLQALEDRLRERFQAGLVADVSPPEFATRLAILRMRAHNDGIHAHESALESIAHRVTMNVRALEGALIRAVAFSSLSGRQIDDELVAEVLNALYEAPREGTRSVADIQAAACRRFGVTQQELLSSSRSARVLRPRQIAMYLARELTADSLPVIGRQFGGRDHTTVLNAWRRTTQRIAEDALLAAEVKRLRDELVGLEL